MSQWNRTENPEINPQKITQLILGKVAKVIQFISANGAGATGHALTKKKNDLCVTHLTYNGLNV